MKCPNCGNAYELFDFFGKVKCYKCIYDEKMQTLKKSKKINLCKICRKKLSSQRWVFCSEECSKKEHKEPWYYKINIYKIPWKSFNKWNY